MPELQALTCSYHKSRFGSQDWHAEERDVVFRVVAVLKSEARGRSHQGWRPQSPGMEAKRWDRV